MLKIDIDYLINEYTRGKTLSELGKEFTTSCVTIRNKLLGAGISMRRTWASKIRECRMCHEVKSIDNFSGKAYVCNKCRPQWNRIKGYTFKKFGITYQDYLNILENQDNKCAICHKPFIDKTPHVDHDHRTGEVRGLLCSGCNTSLGHFDNQDILKGIIAYIA